MKKTFLFLAFSLFAITLVFNSCSSSRDEEVINYTISPSSLTTNYDKTQQLSVLNGSSTLNNSDFNWSSSNEISGKVSSSGLFTAGKIGETTITATNIKNGKSVNTKITVNPYQNFFKEPILEFGQTKEYIKSKETRTLLKETTTGLSYVGENSSIRNIGYTFDSNGKMNSAIVLFDNNVNLVSNVVTFYKERYYYLGLVNNNNSFVTTDKSIGIQIDSGSNSTLGFNALYLKL